MDDELRSYLGSICDGVGSSCKRKAIVCLVDNRNHYCKTCHNIMVDYHNWLRGSDLKMIN